MITNPSPSNKYIYTGNFESVWSLSNVEEELTVFKDTLRHQTNMKMLWSSIRSIVNVKTKKQMTQLSHLLENGNRNDGSTKMANIFNNYFVNVASNIDKSIPTTRKAPTDYLKNRNADSVSITRYRRRNRINYPIP